MDTATPTRRCNLCNTEYPENGKFFYKNASKGNGLNTTCKKCQLKSSRHRYEKIKAAMKGTNSSKSIPDPAVVNRSKDAFSALYGLQRDT